MQIEIVSSTTENIGVELPSHCCGLSISFFYNFSLLSVFCTSNRPLDLSHSFKKYKTTVPRCSSRQMSQGNIQISLNPGTGLGTRVYPDNLHFSDVHRKIFYIHVLPHRAIMLQYHIISPFE